MFVQLKNDRIFGGRSFAGPNAFPAGPFVFLSLCETNQTALSNLLSATHVQFSRFTVQHNTKYNKKKKTQNECLTVAV